ncbi:MAG: cell division protein FtsI/penicillin-binding protein 2 [Amycolatopsis sp.]|jgi:cell division protein FtsI (penicillin-binding protein 3)|uniref:peptidoglycan D,D-transpeptidase FtsI family protein n=1 Tax=Amycolatopsis sp. TaxID=37632 RepID=UPI00261CA28C|nr:penicillin-binding protein 2 [Amycolatopsis sp.]MCU1680462.1 cell division protein FtsI/penicillin-binding protein 2 [Amycolatopsis sp.]
MPARPTGRAVPPARRDRSTARRTYAAGTRKATAKRGNGGTRSRFSVVRVGLVAIMVVAGLKLVQVQGFDAATLSAAAEQQRATLIEIPAQRGSILDRNGNKLAFSVDTRTLSINLRLEHKTWDNYAVQNPKLVNKNRADGVDFETRVAAMAKYIAPKIANADKLQGRVTEQELLDDFHKTQSFTYLVDFVDPSVAADIVAKFPEIAVEKRSARDYPGGSLASNIVGVATWRMDDPAVSKHNLHGRVGLELSRDNDLAGTPGQQWVNTAQDNNNLVIPNTQRDVQPATAGSDLKLTIDSDLQYDLQSKLTAYVALSHAKGGSAVIMDSKTGEVYALANDQTFDPDDLAHATPEMMSNPAVTSPYEPGSVNKVITATGSIDSGIATPQSTISVPGQLQVGDKTVHDAWTHPTQTFTTTGVFAKSSNIGTLELAQKLGPDRFMDLVGKFGLGQRTGVGLPGESAGSVPARQQWSGTTFGNLPIGQGLSMTVLQMAGMYQAIANDGLRVPPRIISGETRPDGTWVPEPAPAPVRVVSPQTAKTVRDMMRAVTQHGKGLNNGTATTAALEGYQISGKTGTAQQVDPRTKAYSDHLYNITFAGILPADHPRFVVGIRLDAPDTTLQVGDSAAPLFHDIASYLTQRYQIPLSDGPTPVVPLVVSTP